MSPASPFPLAWPETLPRAKHREKGRFSTTLSAALKNVRNSLGAFGRDSGKQVGDIVISSNVTLGATHPSDPGVAVWFAWDGLGVCIAVDRYASVEANLQAIHHIIEARRTELRHGTLALVRATFKGFAALPPPPAINWRSVLGIGGGPVDKALIESAFRTRAQVVHPDKGGTAEQMQDLNRARDEALREINEG